MKLKIVNGAVSYGSDTILEEVNFEINNKEKVAIVGRNGCGKTTLLKAIVNNEMFEAGIGEEGFNIYKEGKPVIGYLKQIDFEDESVTLLEEILKVYKPLTLLEEKIKLLEERLKTDTCEETVEEYTDAMERYEFLDGYTYKKEYQTALCKFGFSTSDFSKNIGSFSGGERTKIAFVKLLLSKPDILLLDEPTNHLDITTVEWLESYLKTYPKAVLLVSHDRMFLNKIVSKVYEIEYASVTCYAGNYEDFERQKRINYEKQLKDYEYQQKEIKRLSDIADRFRYKPTKARMAMSKLKQIEQMVKIEEPNRYDLSTFKADFEVKLESGKNVLSVKELEIGYDLSLAKVSFELYKGQKTAIIGANGKGKSTLLKTLMGEVPQISGNFEFGFNVNVEYFDQQMAFVDSNKTVFDEYADTFPELTITEVRSALARFLFLGEDVFKNINVLSGGEKVRLKLCEILKKGANLLFLDEPTNHMDIIGKESLENMLVNYDGTLLFVSHDRYFVNKIADSLLVFKENGEVEFFNGTYKEYSELNLITLPEEKAVEKKEKVKNNEYFISKERNKLKMKLNKVEKDIEEMEKDVKEIEEKMLNEDVYSDYIKLAEYQKELQGLNEKISEKMAEWEDVSNMLAEL